MPDQLPRLQFDRVVPDSLSVAPREPVAAACVGCGTSIDTEYYQVNGHVVCAACRAAAEASAQPPRGIVPLLSAGALGLGAGIVGAIIYYAVIAIANLEIGLIAILIGYMVGYAVRKGARGRGGRRFQVLAVALTYASIAFAYAPLALKGASDAKQKSAQTASATAGKESRPVASADGRTATAEGTRRGSLILAFAVLLLLVAALPMLVVFGSLPSGLISAAIIFFGMSQAWRMTGAPALEILGPYRVGAAAASMSA